MSITLTPAELNEMMEKAVTAAVNAVNMGTTPHETTSRPILKRAERPEIDLGSNEAQWAFFNEEWKSYKRRTAMDEDHVVDELRACCTKELRKTLFDFVGSSTLETMDEIALLEKIKEAAVIGKNVAVHRKEFYGKTTEKQSTCSYHVYGQRVTNATLS